MVAIYETAYPRIKNSITLKEIEIVFQPSNEEMLWAMDNSRGSATLHLILMLKSFQNLGYFTPINQLPKKVISYISRRVDIKSDPKQLKDYFISGTKNRHVQLIRDFLSIKPFDSKARKLTIKIVRLHAKVKDEPQDLINIAIEELVRNKYELPKFNTILHAVERLRIFVRKEFFYNIFSQITPELKSTIDNFFTLELDSIKSKWDDIKKEGGKPTISQVRKIIAHYNWLKEYNSGSQLLSNIPMIKVQSFADEARAYDASKMKELEPMKKYTLAIALIKTQSSKLLDDIAEMIIKRMEKIHKSAKQTLEEQKIENQTIVDDLVLKLSNIITIMGEEKVDSEKILIISQEIGGKSEEILDQCKFILSYSKNNHHPFLWKFFKSHRSVFFEILKNINLKSTSSNNDLIEDIQFMLEHVNKRTDYIFTGKYVKNENSNKIYKNLVKLTWLSEAWWKSVTEDYIRDSFPKKINRRYFEMAVFSQIMIDLKSGNLFIEGSETYSDYRKQLVTEEEFKNKLKEYGEQVNFPIDTDSFINKLKKDLFDSINDTSHSFKENEYVKIKDGKLSISKLKKKPMPENKHKIDKLISEKLIPIGILDVLIDSNSWLNWTKHFGLLSGHETKLDDSIEKYILTTFCYGCNLGPTQTTRSIENLNRKNVSWINKMHITEEKIVKATNHIINSYKHFELTKAWGLGETAAADGTMHDVYENNLFSENHIRYGGYGALGYNHVADNYIALFSNFIPCGVWEGVYILDILQNEDIEIPNIIFGDTQSQNAPVFGLAYLLGIKLMPRIRNLKDYKLFRHDKEAIYKNIDELFSDNINWGIIETYLSDMLRVAISIKAGKITPSTILKRLGTYSRKNALYLAFRELGRAVRTIFLMEYIRDIDVRRMIQGATNKNESYNGFSKWSFFGNNGIITENDRHKQRKAIKYNHLVANCIIFYNVCKLTHILQDLSDEGYEIDKDVVASLSPYFTEHIDRYGKYRLDLNRKPINLIYDLNLKKE